MDSIPRDRYNPKKGILASMRVITGKFKGRKLRAPDGLALRPTSDRVKESLFNILGARVIGSAWLDLFAGTGAIGIEALSREARHVVFVEKQAPAWKALEYNLQHCGIPTGFHLVKSDAQSALSQCTQEGWVFDIIFLDPPYQADLYDEILEAVAANALLVDGGLLIVEHHRKIPPRDAYGHLHRDQTRSYGTTCLSFYKHATVRAEPSAGTTNAI